MDDPSSWLTAAVAIALALAGAASALRLLVRRRRSQDEDRRIIEQLRARVGDVRDVERGNDPDELELGA